MTRKETSAKQCSTRRSMNTEKGFTLLEVLIAITILSVGLLAIASMQIAAIQTTGSAKSISKGIMWAEDRMEMLNSLDYGDALLSGTAGVISDPSPPDGFNISWTVGDNNPRPQCKFITITVQWSERGINKTTTLTGVKPEL